MDGCEGNSGTHKASQDSLPRGQCQALDVLGANVPNLTGLDRVGGLHGPCWNCQVNIIVQDNYYAGLFSVN